MSRGAEITDNVEAALLSGEVPLKLGCSIVDAAKFATPFVLSRLPTALQSLVYGIVIGSLKIQGAEAAAPVMFMTQQGFTGAMRGALAAANTVVGNLNGQKHYSSIGPAVNQNLLLATILGTPITILFFMSPPLLRLFGGDAAVVSQAGSYLRALSYGILPANWAFVDQNFLLSVGRTYPPVGFNILLVGASLAIGIPLTMFTKLGVSGLGYGASAAALFAFLSDRFYLYRHQSEGVLDREKYQLFTRSFNSGVSFRELISLSFPTSLQAISEWLPTMLISFFALAGENSKKTLEAEEPAMQSMVVMNTILLAASSAASVAVSNALGRARRFSEEGNAAKGHVWKQNARTIGNANTIMAVLIIFLPSIFLVIYPDPVVKLFSNETETYPLAKNLLRVVGGSLVLDGIRMTTTGNVLGLKRSVDNFFSSMTNLLITGIAATVVGYYTQDKPNPLSFFISRMMGILLSAIALLIWWNQRSKVSEASVAVAPVVVSVGMFNAAGDHAGGGAPGSNVFDNGALAVPR